MSSLILTNQFTRFTHLQFGADKALDTPLFPPTLWAQKASAQLPGSNERHLAWRFLAALNGDGWWVIGRASSCFTIGHDSAWLWRTQWELNENSMIFLRKKGVTGCFCAFFSYEPVPWQTRRRDLDSWFGDPRPPIAISPSLRIGHQGLTIDSNGNFLGHAQQLASSTYTINHWWLLACFMIVNYYLPISAMYNDDDQWLINQYQPYTINC